MSVSRLITRSFKVRRLHTQSPSAAFTAALKKEDPVQRIKPLDPVFSSYYNSGTALPKAVRQKLGTIGQQPGIVESLETQTQRALKMVRSKQSPIEKYMFMAQLRNRNTKVFYQLLKDHIKEFAPIIYTPTVGEACQKFSDMYPFLTAPGQVDGLYITLEDLPNLDEIIQNYLQRTNMTPDISVITDGSRILGLGDLGINGMPISMGKLQLYVAGAGIDPRRTLPIVLDFGTNTEQYLQDELYLGTRQPRPADDVFYSAMDQVISRLTTALPDMVVQFEDFSSEHAFGLLEKYQDKVLCFNDDIQGTGAVILSGLINAFRSVESDVSIRDHRLVFYGAGSAAIGVANQIREYLQLQYGISEQDARNMFYVCDSKGLITADRGDKLADHKVYYARNDNQGLQFKSLDAILDYVKPTTLIGLSASHGAFTKEVLTRMSKLNKQPIVFPLSNPATKSECTFADAMEATDNSVIFASGTAFPAYQIPNTTDVRVPGQGNNMYMFPGLGLGAILCRPVSITDRIILRASKALADTLTEEERNKGYLYPELDRIRDVSAKVAVAVCDQALKDGVATKMLNIPSNGLLDYVKSNMWQSDSIEN